MKSFGGALYFVTFIDDYSRKLWVYALKSKDQVLEKFKEFHASVERQSGKKLKCIRTESIVDLLISTVSSMASHMRRLLLKLLS